MRNLLILLLLISPRILAETVTWQGFDIHYTTFTSTLIPAEVAQAHDIVRSDKRVVTNIVIQRDGAPVAAEVTGTATNLLNQLFNLGFVEVQEQDAIYYLASQIIDQRDTLRFTIDITPVTGNETYTLKFSRQYFKGAQ